MNPAETLNALDHKHGSNAITSSKHPTLAIYEDGSCRSANTRDVYACQFIEAENIEPYKLARNRHVYAEEIFRRLKHAFDQNKQGLKRLADSYAEDTASLPPDERDIEKLKELGNKVREAKTKLDARKAELDAVTPEDVRNKAKYAAQRSETADRLRDLLSGINV